MKEKFRVRGDLITFRNFCVLNDIEPQAGMVYRKLGLIKEVVEKRNKRIFIFINKNDIKNLIENEHYVICPKCGKKAIALNKNHFKKCNIESKNLYARIFYKSHKKTDTQKQRQALMMNKHYLTSAGDLTKRRVSEATKKRLSDENYRNKQINDLVNFNKSDKGREIKSKLTKEFWTREDYRNKILKYISENKEKVDISISYARKFNSKISWLSLDFYIFLHTNNINWLELGFPYYYYELDIADTLNGIAIEIDGCYWHGCTQCGFRGRKNVQSSDKIKNSFLEKRGWIVLRLKEHELVHDLEVCLTKVKEVLKQAEARPFRFRDKLNTPDIRMKSLIKANGVYLKYYRRLNEKKKEWNTIKPKKSISVPQ